jgi:homocitrate synthase
MRALRQRYPNLELEGHFHDDRGFALINALEAINSGMRYVQTTLLGIGERSGITSMTALLFNLYIDKAYDHLEGYNLRGSYPINVMFASKLKKLVPSTEPVSLTNRTHTAGVHQKAVLNHAATYEAFHLDQFGVNESEVLLGPLSGWNIIHYFLKEIKYYNLGEGTARQIAAAFKERVYNIGPQDSPAEILIDIAENEFGLSRIAVPERFKDNILQRMDEEHLDAEQPENIEAEGNPKARREAAINLKRS